MQIALCKLYVFVGLNVLHFWNRDIVGLQSSPQLFNNPLTHFFTVRKFFDFTVQTYRVAWYGMVWYGFFVRGEYTGAVVVEM